jgi:hypothetical protein
MLEQVPVKVKVLGRVILNLAPLLESVISLGVISKLTE